MTRHQVLCSRCSRPRRWRLAIWRHEPLPLVTPSLDIFFLVEHELISSSLDTFSSSSTNWFPDVITRHVFLVEHELISRYHQTSLDTFSSSSTNWFPDVITRHVFLVEHELISWLYHQTSLDTFSSSSTNFETKSTSLFKGLVDPPVTKLRLRCPSSTWSWSPRWLPPPSPTSSSSPS